MTDTVGMTAHETPNRVMAAATIAIASFALGGLTSYAQEFLPSDVRSFANSASGWTLITVGLVFWSRLPARWAAPLGATAIGIVGIGLVITTLATRVRGALPVAIAVIGTPLVACAFNGSFRVLGQVGLALS